MGVFDWFVRVRSDLKETVPARNSRNTFPLCKMGRAGIVILDWNGANAPGLHPHKVVGQVG